MDRRCYSNKSNSSNRNNSNNTNSSTNAFMNDNFLTTEERASVRTRQQDPNDLAWQQLEVLSNSLHDGTVNSNRYGGVGGVGSVGVGGGSSIGGGSGHRRGGDYYQQGEKQQLSSYNTDYKKDFSSSQYPNSRRPGAYFEEYKYASSPPPPQKARKERDYYRELGSSMHSHLSGDSFAYDQRSYGSGPNTYNNNRNGCVGNHHQHPHNTNNNNNDSHVTYVEIMPGVKERLRSASETWGAIQDDFYLPVTCFGCSLDLFCITDAKYVICPDCRVVSPMEEREGKDGSRGVGLGFKFEELFKWQAQILQERDNADNGGGGGGGGGGGFPEELQQLYPPVSPSPSSSPLPPHSPSHHPHHYHHHQQEEQWERSPSQWETQPQHHHPQQQRYPSRYRQDEWDQPSSLPPYPSSNTPPPAHRDHPRRWES